MKNLLLLAALALVLRGAAQNREQVGQEQMAVTLARENAAPKSFLALHGWNGGWHLTGLLKDKRNGTYDIGGDVISTATMAQYKDIKVKVKWFSDTDTLLGADDFVSYQLIKYGGMVHISLHATPPAGFEKNFRVEIVGATAVR